MDTNAAAESVTIPPETDPGKASGTPPPEDGGKATPPPPPPPSEGHPRSPDAHGNSVDPPKPPAPPKGGWGGKRPRAGRKPNVEAPPSPPPPGAPAPPFHGGPVGTQTQTPAASGSTGAKKAADPAKAAKILTAMIDGAIVGVAKVRYDGITLANGKPLWELASAGPEQSKEIEEAILAFMAAYTMNVTPGQAVVLAIAAAYVPTAFALERARASVVGGQQVEE